MKQLVFEKKTHVRKCKNKPEKNLPNDQQQN
jgi:hypothetical protein